QLSRKEAVRAGIHVSDHALDLGVGSGFVALVMHVGMPYDLIGSAGQRKQTGRGHVVDGNYDKANRPSD
ncbi:hypothetical protein E4U13_000690, partial [Claviceps humidiphila]